jgi:hypothetical protein
MSQNAYAMLSWFPREKGGMRGPPAGDRFSAPVEFWTGPGCRNGEWSLVMEFIHFYEAGRYAFAAVRFLVPEGPHALLADGHRFGVDGGRRLVAAGLVCASPNPPAAAASFAAVLPS